MTNVRVDAAMDDPTGIERQIRVAAMSHLLVLYTANFDRVLRDPNDPEHADRHSDMEIAKKMGHKVSVLLERGVTVLEGYLPTEGDVTVIEVDLSDPESWQPAVSKLVLGR